MKHRIKGLRGKVVLVLAVVALVPALLLGGLGMTAVSGLSGLARAHAEGALEQELRQRLITRVQEKARADDAVFQGVLAQAVSLSRYVKWYYDNPDHRPEPGYLRGGSDLVETPLGHRVNRPDTAVGVFVSRQADMSAVVWQEVGALSFADPLLTAIGDSTPGAGRAWVISSSRIVRMYPNQQLGHSGSAVGPDYDVTRDEPFQAASPARNPGRQPVWTAPYLDPVDPASGRQMITAVAPIYEADDGFRGVAGVDMDLAGVLDSVVSAQMVPGGYALLLDREGRLVSAPDAAWEDLSLPAAAGSGPGQAVVTTLGASTSKEVVRLASRVQGAAEPGLATFSAAGGRRHIAYAPLPSTGWVLAMVVPSEQAEESLLSVQNAIRQREGLFLAGGIGAVMLALVLAALLAARASGLLTRPVADLVAGTERLARDLSHRLPEDGTDEFGHLSRAFNAMAASLEQSRAEAVRQGRLVAEERNRLAREIHDTIAQGLTGIVVHLETVEACLGTEPDPDAVKHLDRARQLARESLREARRSVWNLRPSQVEESGLPRALERLAASMRADGFVCSVAVEGDAVLSAGAEDALFRTCQEALANVRKYSGARSVAIRLTGRPDAVILQVTDDGRGFDPAALAGPHPEGGFGLWAMRERMEQAGGWLRVESNPGRGTAVTASVPVGARRGCDGAGDQGAGS